MVVPVQLVLVGTGSAGQQNVHIEIVVWFFSVSPVLSYRLVNNYGSLNGEGEKHRGGGGQSGEIICKKTLTGISGSYLGRSVATAHLLLFVQPPDDQSGIFKRLHQHNAQG